MYNIGHKSNYLVRAVMIIIEYLNLDLKNCRGQSYDNENNMSEWYKSLKSRIKELNPP